MFNSYLYKFFFAYQQQKVADFSVIYNNINQTKCVQDFTSSVYFDLVQAPEDINILLRQHKFS